MLYVVYYESSSNWRIIWCNNGSYNVCRSGGYDDEYDPEVATIIKQLNMPQSEYEDVPELTGFNNPQGIFPGFV